MRALHDFSKRQLIAAGVIVVIALIGTIFLVGKSGALRSSGEMKITEPGDAVRTTVTETTVTPPAEPAKLCVHVAGKVKAPGVYEFDPGCRVKDALEAAGGALPNADLETINLAEKLVDGEQVYIAVKGAVLPPAVSGVKGGSSPVTAKTTKPANSEGEKKPSAPEKLQTPGQGTVNINTAGLDELQRLSGIGPAMAQRIIDYRNQHGKFQSIDQLDEVNGIGDATLAKLRPFVTL